MPCILLGALPRISTTTAQRLLLVCMNHSSWWDVMLGLFIEQKLFGWEMVRGDGRAAINALQVLCAAGRDRGGQDKPVGGAGVSGVCKCTLLKDKRRSLWMTPQGEMLSNYARPVVFQPGMGHLAGSLSDFYFTRVVLHYEYWNERLPEAFVSISPVERVSAQDGSFDRKRWTHAQETGPDRAVGRPARRGAGPRHKRVPAPAARTCRHQPHV